jgi:2-polyprenyl-3-methyl-5-hydroxy-6-metoxy-1,4-benzoquinol methylase
MSSEYESYLSNHLGRLRQSDSFSKKKQWIVENYSRLVPLDKASHILEIGPGFGEFLDFLVNDHGCEQVTAIDYSRQVVEHCERLGNVTAILVTDSEKFLVENKAKYELVVMLHVLEHIPKSQVIPLLTAIRTALTPTGRLLIEVPNMANPLTGVYMRYSDFTHESGYTDVSLQEVLRAAGFDSSVYGVQVPRVSLARRLQSIAQHIFHGLVNLTLKLYMPTSRHNLSFAIYAVAQQSKHAV